MNRGLGKICCAKQDKLFLLVTYAVGLFNKAPFTLNTFRH
jgi:hypothetical protein